MQSDVATNVALAQPELPTPRCDSHSVDVAPHDSRCRYWAKIFRHAQPLLNPCDVDGANDVPGSYLRRGEEELMPGDALLEGEANHRRRTDRGWSYRVTVVTLDGRCLQLLSGEFGAAKALMKATGLRADLLRGSGDVAAMVRVVHAIRAGIQLAEDMT